MTHLTDEELTTTSEQQNKLTRLIKENLGTYSYPAYVDGENLDYKNPYWDMIKDIKDENKKIDKIEFYSEDENINPDTSEGEDYNESISKEFGDNNISAKGLLPNCNNMSEAVIISRKRDINGDYLLEKLNLNPLLDTRIYNVFPPMEYETGLRQIKIAQ